MIVPDEWDVVAASIPVAGEAAVAAHKVFKVGKGVIRFAEFAAKLTTKLAGHADEIRAAGRTALQVADDVPIITRTRLKLVRMRRGGKLPSGAVREEAKLGEVERKLCWVGSN